MKIDRDGIISIIIGIVLMGIAYLWKLAETPDPVSALLGLIVETIRGGLVGVGILFFVVGLLFIFG
jgi:hypothetical protein